MHRDPSHKVSSGSSDTSGTVFTSEHPPPSVPFFVYQNLFEFKSKCHCHCHCPPPWAVAAVAPEALFLPRGIYPRQFPFLFIKIFLILKVSATATATGGALVGSGYKDCSRKVLENGARIQRVDGRWHAQKCALELKQAGCLPRLNEPRWEIFRAKVA